MESYGKSLLWGLLPPTFRCIISLLLLLLLVGVVTPSRRSSPFGLLLLELPQGSCNEHRHISISIAKDWINAKGLVLDLAGDGQRHPRFEAGQVY